MPLINAYGGIGTSSDPSAYAIIFVHSSIDSPAAGNFARIPSIFTNCLSAFLFLVPVRINFFLGISTSPTTLTRNGFQNPSFGSLPTPTPGESAPGFAFAACSRTCGTVFACLVNSFTCSTCSLVPSNAEYPPSDMPILYLPSMMNPPSIVVSAMSGKVSTRSPCMVALTS